MGIVVKAIIHTNDYPATQTEVSYEPVVPSEEGPDRSVTARAWHTRNT